MSIKLKDTITDLINNSDKLDGKHASDFSLTSHTHSYLPYYTLDSGSSSSLDEGLTALKVVDTTAGNPNNHSAYLYIKSVGTPFQIQFPDSSDMYLYKRYYSSGTWSTWSKMKAGYADTAGIANSVTWGNISGKPSTYPHAEHSHPYLPLSGGTLTGPLTIEPNAKDSLNIGNGVGQFRFQNTGTVDGSYSSIYAHQRGQLIFTDTSISSLKFVQSGVSTYRTIYHSGNLTKLSQLTNDSGFITGSYLPLSGGNMAKSGYITFTSPASSSVIDSTAFAITYGKIQAAAPISIIGDTDGTGTEYVIITSGYTAANSTKANGLAVGKSELLWKNNTILTSGNYSSTCDTRYLKKAGDTMTGPLTVPFSNLIIGSDGGDSATTRVLKAYSTNANTYINFGYSPALGNCAEIAWGYSSSGSTSNYTYLGFYGGYGLYVYYNDHNKLRLGNTSNYVTVLTSGNWNSYCAAASHSHSEYAASSHSHSYLPLSGGGTLTGSAYISMSGTANNSSLNDSTPFGITYSRIQGYGTMTIAADTDGSKSEYLILTAGYGVSSATAANGLAIGYSTLKWKGTDISLSGHTHSYYDGYVMTHYIIDASGLNQNTYYPVTMPIGSSPNVRIEVIVSLNSGSTPSWSTHGSGFSVRKIWEVNGSGWGTNNINRRILISDYQHTSTDPVRGIGQLSYSSTEYVYVRGGGKYFFKVSHGIVPTLRTSEFVGTGNPYYQSISPTTSAPAGIGRNIAYTSDIPASLKCPNSLTIQLNGTSQGAWDGSSAKTINITPASIGASASHSHPYLSTAGGALTGPLTFANGTWNVVGDDAAIGDYNAAGMLGLKSCNNALPGIGFHNNSNTLLGTLICNAGTLTWNKTFNCATLQIGGETITFTT